METLGLKVSGKFLLEKIMPHSWSLVIDVEKQEK